MVSIAHGDRRGHGSHRPGAGQGGFTLIELTLVMLVIGLMMAITLPKFRNIGGGDMKLEARTLIGQIQGLYSEATFTRRQHRLVFDLDRNRYWGEAEVPSKRQRDEQGRPILTKKVFRPVTRDFLKPVTLPRGVELTDVIAGAFGKRSGGTVYTNFYPLGRTDFTTIHLEDDDSDVMTLMINPVTGRVTVADNYLEQVTVADNYLEQVTG